MTDAFSFGSVLAVVVGSVTVATLARNAFGTWLQQRERERLSATDKAELLAKLKEQDSKLLELKNMGLARRT